jgi:hypothetical protein
MDAKNLTVRLTASELCLMIGAIDIAARAVGGEEESIANEIIERLSEAGITTFGIAVFEQVAA